MSYTILLVDSSPMGERSVTRKLTAKVVEGLKARHPHAVIVTRDLDALPLPHLNSLTIGAFFTPPDQQNDMLKNAIKPSDNTISELMAADAIVIGAPMHNFGIPSSLKAWVDHLIRSGKTFKYGADGRPVGLVPATKKVIVVSARGGVYSSGPMAALDHQETYMRSVLAFIGLTDVTFVRAEGISMGPDAAAHAMEQAEGQVVEVLHHVA